MRNYKLSENQASMLINSNTHFKGFLTREAGVSIKPRA